MASGTGLARIEQSVPGKVELSSAARLEGRRGEALEEGVRAPLIAGRDTRKGQDLAGLPDQQGAGRTNRPQCLVGGLLGRLSIGI